MQILGLRGPNIENIFNALKTKGLIVKLKLTHKRLFSREILFTKYPIDRHPGLIGYYYGRRIGDLLVRYVKLAIKEYRMGKEGLIQQEEMLRSIQKWLSTV
jgi:hypothetical protein